MIYLYSHGGSDNHGCEAIVRSTINILEKPVRLMSNNIEQDIKYGIDHLCEIISDSDEYLKRGSVKWFLANLQIRCTGKLNLLIRYRRKKLFDNVSKGDVCLSIGGDNYCYAGTEVLVTVNQELYKKGAQLILWGCSVEPDLVEIPKIAHDLSKYKMIVARESFSYKALKKVNSNTVLVPDPAFTLPRKDLPLPKGWIEDNMVGINVSPLILQNAKNSDMVFSAYRKLIEKILSQTDFGIALIPHVVDGEKSDLIPLKQLYQEYKNSERVVLIDDYNCMELKGYIARCRFFVGARTHATIAAYSSGVPTLVLGYSVKSRGIATDIFGTEKNFVIPVARLEKDDELAARFFWLMKNEYKIKRQLSEVIPNYIESAKIEYEKVCKKIEKLNIKNDKT